MNVKEIAEIRRRYRADKSNISRICGCYVNEKKEIVSEFNQSLGLMTQDESEEILAILKKTLSGTLGKNLIDIEFSTNQVLDDEQHKTLMALKNSELEDAEAVKKLYDSIISSLKMEGSYLIILSCDKYDVFKYSSDGHKEEDSNEIFTYILCSICPVKPAKPTLSYYARENTFRNSAADRIVGAPELGFMFPAFNDRQSNIYNALYYTHNIAEERKEFVEAVFNSTTPMPAAVQKETFENIFEQSISDACSMDVVQNVHKHISGIIEEYKSGNEEEPLSISVDTVKEVLVSSGVSETHIEAFAKGYETEFGEGTQISPQNIVNTRQFEVKTPDVAIKVNPERMDLVETRVIDGVKYILVRAEDSVEVNGVNIHI